MSNATLNALLDPEVQALIRRNSPAPFSGPDPRVQQFLDAEQDMMPPELGQLPAAAGAPTGGGDQGVDYAGIIQRARDLTKVPEPDPVEMPQYKNMPAWALGAMGVLDFLRRSKSRKRNQKYARNFGGADIRSLEKVPESMFETVLPLYLRTQTRNRANEARGVELTEQRKQMGDRQQNAAMGPVLSNLLKGTQERPPSAFAEKTAAALEQIDQMTQAGEIDPETARTLKLQVYGLEIPTPEPQPEPKPTFTPLNTVEGRKQEVEWAQGQPWGEKYLQGQGYYPEPQQPGWGRVAGSPWSSPPGRMVGNYAGRMGTLMANRQFGPDADNAWIERRATEIMRDGYGTTMEEAMAQAQQERATMNLVLQQQADEAPPGAADDLFGMQGFDLQDPMAMLQMLMGGGQPQGLNLAAGGDPLGVSFPQSQQPAAALPPTGPMPGRASMGVSPSESTTDAQTPVNPSASQMDAETVEKLVSAYWDAIEKARAGTFMGPDGTPWTEQQVTEAFKGDFPWLNPNLLERPVE